MRLPKFLPKLSLPAIPKIQFATSAGTVEADAPAKRRPTYRNHRNLVTVDDDGPAPDEPPVENELSEDMALEDASAEAESEYEADADAEEEFEEEEDVEAEVEQPETDVEEEEPGKRDLSKIKVRLPNMVKKVRNEPPPPQELGDYELPDWDVLEDAESGFAEQQEEYVRAKAEQLEEAFEEFGVNAHVEAIETGPVITMYEIGVAKGTKVSAITGLSNDLARTLAAESVRVVAPIPGKNTIGIEVPNAEKEKVRIKDLMQLAPAKVEKMHIPLYLGKDSSGAPLITDLAAMPHCLIAGTTGSGKSVCINTIIMSIMYTQRPDEVKLVLVDPKVVEMAPFKDIPHLMCPVITDAAKANSVLEWACTKMDERYEILAEAGCRNIASYNKLEPEELVERFDPATPEEEAKIPKKLPYMVIIIDELADLMMTAGKEVEAHIVRIAQKARAVGIHLILATQRPQANVVTGLIKSNMPSKIAFRVASKMDSRIVLDQNGAELLLGQGDMLFLPPGASKPLRSQGTFIDDMEIRSSVKKVKELAEAQYEPELVQIKNGINMASDEERDELYEDAVRVVLETRRGSVSLLQRKLTIGYARASRMIEQMAADGIVGEYKGSQAREATLTIEEWEELKAAQEEGAELYVDADMDEEQAGVEYDEADDDEESGDADEDVKDGEALEADAEYEDGEA
ncbi:MAG: DNA translocase FtsK, partial [Planctomycetota bacterium]